MPRPRLSAQALFRKLRRRPARKAEAFDRAIHDALERDLAVLVVDSSGFTRRVLESGILPFLSALQACHDAVVPLLERLGGRLLSRGADNLLLTFPDALSAAKAAREAQRFLRRRNRRRAPADRFHLCMGIDAGPVLELSDDVYGAAVNVASKLGEDLADRDEILLTGEVARRLKGRLRTVYARSTQVGGQIFELHRLPL